LVAFLNSRGGTLLIGVADDGTIVGIDESKFESRDRVNLHLTNLLATHIGNEFLPFITFRLSDYQGKGIMRVVCRKSDSPVFLKEGKQETFFVRSGSSSIELHGMDTLNYVDNRFKRRINRKMFEE
jgi:predicted HTH transcriptional regulator